MARKRKTHIRSPLRGKESICGLSSVDFEEIGPKVTCKTCGKLATDGTLERMKYERKDECNEQSQKGANYTGQPRFTEKQREFAKHPLVTTNPEKAALESGYSDSFAKTKAIALRKQMAPLIMEYQEKAKQISAISVARVQSELASMGFANMLDYFNVRDDGSLFPKQLNEITREQAAAIQEVKVIEVETEDEEGNVTKRTVIGHIKLADKRANLVELGKTLGMFNKITIEDKREQKMLMDDVPTDALEQAEQLLISAAAHAKHKRETKGAVEGEFTEVPSTPAITESK